MLWKIGCGTVLLGITLSVGSCALFGTAFHKAMDQRQVSQWDFPHGEQVVSHSAEVEEGTAVRIGLRATVQIPESEWRNEPRDRGDIISTSVTVNYRVLDEFGESVHVGAGKLDGTVIVPASDHPSAETFDGYIDVSHQSEVFEPEGLSRLTVEIEMPAVDDNGWEVFGGELEIYDRIPQSSARFALGGLASFFLGPLVTGLGVLLFIVGILTRKRSSGPA